MSLKEVQIRTTVDYFGDVTKIIQDHNGDFLSVEQEGDELVILAKIQDEQIPTIKKALENTLENRFSIKIKG